MLRVRLLLFVVDGVHLTNKRIINDFHVRYKSRELKSKTSAHKRV
jgi:hypothetical protein